MLTSSPKTSKIWDSPKKKWLLSLVSSSVALRFQFYALTFYWIFDLWCLGAHTIGRSHCLAFRNRLYSFNSTTSQDPSLDPSYAAQLKQQCPEGSTDASLVVPMNPVSPAITDECYYTDILANRGLFTSDQTLLTNPTTAIQVIQNARYPFLWKSKFASAMVKMGQIGVLTGTAGEIRANCRVINSWTNVIYISVF